MHKTSVIPSHIWMQVKHAKTTETKTTLSFPHILTILFQTLFSNVNEVKDNLLMMTIKLK